MEVEIEVQTPMGESHRSNTVLLHPNSSTMKEVLVTGKHWAGPSAGKPRDLAAALWPVFLRLRLIS